MSVARARFSDLTSHVVAFCRRLRAHGLPVGPREAADALRALSAVDVADRRECYLALRAVLASRRDDLAVFD
ncbi:MAG TPA: VWA containing CoxE family protein, partial [bacterium]|nr:VWA containing CoxE family protein [bacterium]